MNKKIAYITSGKIGIHRFTFNELVLLEQKGIDFILCLTQLNKGPVMPSQKWKYIIANKGKAFIEFFKFLLKNKNTLKLFLEAIKYKVVPYFFIALSFHNDLKKGHISSIHCQMGDEKLYIGYFLKKFFGIPLTVTVHAHELYKRKVYDNNEEIKNLYSFCDKVITISDFNAKLIHESFGVKKEKIEVMRLFPDIDHLHYVRDKTKILIVANWAEKKGYDILLQALKKVNREDYVLWVVGGSYYSENSIDVEKYVKDYGLENNVAILGRQSSPILDILFYACDIFCLPSYTEFYNDGKPAEREGIPVALMEAMKWGKPVIATRHAGNPELINEILVEEKNIEELTASLEYLLNNPQVWKQMGEKNQEIIDQKYSKSNIDTLVKIFKNL